MSCIIIIIIFSFVYAFHRQPRLDKLLHFNSEHFSFECIWTNPKLLQSYECGNFGFVFLCIFICKELWLHKFLVITFNDIFY